MEKAKYGSRGSKACGGAMDSFPNEREYRHHTHELRELCLRRGDDVQRLSESKDGGNIGEQVSIDGLHL